MDPFQPALSPHPAGEQPSVEDWSATADTFAGRVHVEWDRGGLVTPLGQLPFFIEYLKQAGLFAGWVADCPKKGAHDFADHLLTKAAERLRRGDYYCRRLGAHLSWIGDLGGWWEETDFHETRGTGFLLARLEEIWKWVPRTKPLSVGVVLLDLMPVDQH